MKDIEVIEVESDVDLEDLELEKLVEEEVLTVDQWLDRDVLDRLEYDRIENDLYPGITIDSEAPYVHRDTDAVQAWLARERHIPIPDLSDD